MNCPLCSTPMTIEKRDGIVYWDCSFCDETIIVEKHRDRRYLDGHVVIGMPDYTPRPRWMLLGRIILFFRRNHDR